VKGGEEEGKTGRGGKRKGGEGRAPPIFYCTPSSSFLEICLLRNDVSHHRRGTGTGCNKQQWREELCLVCRQAWGYLRLRF